MAGEKGSAFINALLKLVFNATAIANIADNAGSGPLTNLYYALHTDDPQTSGNQNTFEVSYTGYSRIAASRDSGGFTIVGTRVNPAADVVFGLCTVGNEEASHFSIGTASSGTGMILYAGPLSPAINIEPGVTPKIKSGSSITEF